MADRQEAENLRKELIRTIEKMGYPESFGAAVAGSLGTEKTMARMIRYLKNAKPRSAEEIADEMLAILDDRERWIKKKTAEYYNEKYNELQYYGLGVEEEEPPDEEPPDGELRTGSPWKRNLQKSRKRPVSGQFTGAESDGRRR